MEPSPEPIDDIFRERVRRARRMTPGERLIAGLRLFDDVCAIVKAGNRGHYPDYSDEQVRRKFRIKSAQRYRESTNRARRALRPLCGARL